MTRLAEALERASAANRSAKQLETPARQVENTAKQPEPVAKQLEPVARPVESLSTEVEVPELRSRPTSGAEQEPSPESADAAPLPVVVAKPALVMKPSAAKPGKSGLTKGSAPVSMLRAPAAVPSDMPVHADPELTGKLVGTPGVPFGCVEQYRKLAATLHHIQAERGIKVLMVSSAVASEGKTLTSTNIALTLSESYAKKVLIIDADLRRPTLHQIFDLPNLTGLSDALRSEKDRPLPLTQVASRLSALTAGRPDPDPMSGLTSPRMRRIVQEAAGAFDWVIIDTPPAGLLPDAKLITELAEAAVLVIRSGRAPVQLIMQAIEALGRDRIVGVVLNGVDAKASNAVPYYGGYGGYYGYGGYDQPSRGTRG